MKIGIFISGHVREAPITKENFSQFLNSEHELFVYVGTWKNYDIDRQTHQIIDRDMDVERKFNDVFGNKLCGFFAEDPHKFAKTGCINNNVPVHKIEEYIRREEIPYIQFLQKEHNWNDWPFLQRILDQQYVIYNTALMAGEQYSELDACIRLRADMRYVGKPRIPIENLHYGVHVSSYWFQPTGTEDDTGISPFRISDHMLWGTPNSMLKYFQFYNHYIDMLVPRIKLPMNKFFFGIEHWLAYYLTRWPFYNTKLIPEDMTMPNDIPIYREGYPELIRHNRSTPEDPYSQYDFYDLFNNNFR